MLILLVCAALAAAAIAVGPGPLARLDPRLAAAGRERRRALPALVDAVGAALASGLSLELAFAEVASTLPAPLDARSRAVAAALRLGVRLDDALDAFTDVAPPRDLAAFRVVLGAFARTGGRVQRSLGRVSVLLRGRLSLMDEQAALTAQGRLSAIVLVALAPLGAAFFALLMPSYLATLFGPGLWLLVTAGALEIAAAVWLARIVRTIDGRADLASLIDAVVVGLEAGLTFQQALAELVRRAPEVARLREARRLLADLTLGRGMAASFSEFAAAGAAEARVAGLVLASTRLGAPLAELLVVQADSLRDGERRRTEARARRLPVLMLFPLTFCVLPALLCVFLGPPLLTLLR